MSKLNVLEYGKKAAGENEIILRYVCPSHNKNTVKISGGDDWLRVEFSETDLCKSQVYEYNCPNPVKSVNCKFIDGVLSLKLTFDMPKTRKLNVTFD